MNVHLDVGPDTAGMPEQTELPPLFDKSALAFIRRNVQILVRLVADFLEFTHTANEVLSLELVKVDAHEVIRLALRNLESQQKGAGIGIDLQLQAPPRPLRGDAFQHEKGL